MAKILERYTIYDLLIIAVMAAIGIAIKPVVASLAQIISGPVIPGGALAGGFYMMWLVVGFGITKKYGTATLIGIIQALLVIFTGVVGSHGILSLVSYTLPGLLMDIVLFLMKNRVDNPIGAFVGGAVANLTGTFAVNFLFFSLPILFMVLSLSVAALSGGLGGLIAYQLLKVLNKYKLVRKPIKQMENQYEKRYEEK